MDSLTAREPGRYILNAGRKGPYRFFDSDSPALHYGALSACAVLVAWMTTLVWRPWGLLLSTLVFALGVAALVLVYFGAWAWDAWWHGEVHFVQTDARLECGYGTTTRRTHVRRFEAGAPLVASVVPARGIPRIVISSGTTSFALGVVADVYPREFTRWSAWAGERGWRVDDSAVTGSDAIQQVTQVADAWVEFRVPGGADGGVWGVPHGPSESGYPRAERADWLPSDNSDNIGSFESPSGAGPVVSVAARVGDIPPGASLVEFGAAAAGATIMQGDVLAELEFADAVDAVGVSQADDGRVELTFRAVGP